VTSWIVFGSGGKKGNPRNHTNRNEKNYGFFMALGIEKRRSSMGKFASIFS
jgi:hypothetical protein